MSSISVVDESVSITPELKRKSKEFLVHDERWFRCIKYGIRFVPHKEMREGILKRLHDEVGHWDFNSTYLLVRDHFWWPNMRQQVGHFVNICYTCQQTKPVNRKGLAGKIPISGLFHTWCIHFAGTLPCTNAGNQCLIVGIEQILKSCRMGNASLSVQLDWCDIIRQGRNNYAIRPTAVDPEWELPEVWLQGGTRFRRSIQYPVEVHIDVQYLR